jgi:hypothetical protein
MISGYPNGKHKMSHKLIIILSFVIFAVQGVFAGTSDTGAFNQFINNDTDGSSFEKAIVLPDICDYSKCLSEVCEQEVFERTLSRQELKYAAVNYGQRGKDWEVAGFDEVNSYVFNGDRYYDDLGIEIMGTGKKKVLRFDVTASVDALRKQQFSRKY